MTGTIGFSKIPANLRVPGIGFEFNPSRNNGGTQNLKALIVGQVLPGSAWAQAPFVNTPFLCLGTADARLNAGAGSMLALAVARFKARLDFSELWVMPLVDDGASAAATGTMTFTGPASATGTLPPYVDYQTAPTLVLAGSPANQIASAVTAAVNLLPDMPVTAAATGAVVTLTAKNKGAAGNDIDIRMAYRGSQGGEAIPAGVGVTIAPMSGGTTNPSLSAPLLNLADLPFEVIVCPYTDSASLDAMKLLMDENNGRWSWTRKLYGHVYAVKAANLSAATTFGVTRNDPHVTVMPIGACPLSPVECAADLAAAVMESVSADPAVPIQFLPTNIPPPAPGARFAPSDRQVLLYDGLSTYKVERGTTLIERLVTTYQVNNAGAPDSSYLDVETMHTLGYVCRDLDAFLTEKFFATGFKLVGDDVRIPGGVKMVSPAVIKATLDTRYRYLCEVPAVCQDADGFAKESRVELAGGGRVNIYAPIRIMGQLRIMAIQVAFNKPT